MNRLRLIILVVLLALIGTGIGLFVWYRGLTDKIFVSLIDPVVAGSATPTPRQYPNSIAQHLTEKTPFSILLLGYGGGKHDGTFLTDSMIVAHIDPARQRVTLISIPRDLWVVFPTDNTSHKINSAYSAGINQGAATAGKFSKDAVAVVLGKPIDYFVSVDFEGFKKTIDTLGGVDVKVDVTFDDFQYPVDGKENELCGHDPSELPAITATASATTDPQNIFPCRYEHLHFDKGVVHMDGATALKFVRSRHSVEDGNDFGRARRQKNLLIAVKQRILSINFLPKSIAFVNSLGDDVRTDLSQGDARELLANASDLASYQISSLALTNENYLIDSYSPEGQYILAPKTGIDNWDEVHAWFTRELAPPATPSATPAP